MVYDFYHGSRLVTSSHDFIYSLAALATLVLDTPLRAAAHTHITIAINIVKKSEIAVQSPQSCLHTHAEQKYFELFFRKT